MAANSKGKPTDVSLGFIFFDISDCSDEPFVLSAGTGTGLPMKSSQNLQLSTSFEKSDMEIPGFFRTMLQKGYFACSRRLLSKSKKEENKHLLKKIKGEMMH